VEVKDCKFCISDIRISSRFIAAGIPPKSMRMISGGSVVVEEASAYLKGESEVMGLVRSAPPSIKDKAICEYPNHLSPLVFILEEKDNLYNSTRKMCHTVEPLKASFALAPACRSSGMRLDPEREDTEIAFLRRASMA